MKIEFSCLFCKKKTIKEERQYRLKFCSIQCQAEHRFKDGYERWIAGKYSPSAKVIRKFLRLLKQYKCSECGIKNWNGKPITFEVEHLDGNPENNLPDNLTFLCPNCHSQTSTFRSLNRGNGREHRRKATRLQT